jgi:hypothetical protein
VTVYLGGLAAAARAGKLLARRLTRDRADLGDWVGAGCCARSIALGALAVATEAAAGHVIVALGAAFAYASAIVGARRLLSLEGLAPHGLAAGCTAAGTGPALLVYGV